MTTRILFLTKYSRLSASSRLRAFQYQSRIDKTKYSASVQSLFSDKYLLMRFKSSNISNIHRIIYSFTRRMFFLLKVCRYDILIIHLELFPHFPPIFEYLLSKTNKKIYYDYDDAIFHVYDKSNNSLARFLLSNKIKSLMRVADGVICCNEYIRKYAIESGAKRTLLLPTVINLDNYISTPKKHEGGNNFTIGWIGSPSTTKYLDMVIDSIARLSEFYSITLHLVGSDINKHIAIKNVKVVRDNWSEFNEQKALREFDIGIMPLYDNDWDRGKCAFKLIQYMGSFLPVVASDVGMNRDLVGKSGIVVKNSSEWFDAIKILFDDECMRTKMGKIGRKTIQDEYTIERALPKLINFIDP